MGETFADQSLTPVVTNALWQWAGASGAARVATGYPTGSTASGTLFSPTKTGTTVDDLKSYLLVPIQVYGNPPTPVPDSTIMSWIRFAEDEFEQDTNIRLCQTWIAAPPVPSFAAMTQMGLVSEQGNLYQQLGVDYDFYEPAYDFFFQRAQDEGWLYQRMRWRPVQSLETFQPAAATDPASPAIKNLAFVYPLLNEYFRMPSSWVVEDRTRGLIRFVPAQNVQMLPLFAIQLAFMGFAESVPGAMWFQYTAGLTPNDYNSQWSFVKQAILAKAGATALRRIQLSVNFGATETQLQVDGLSYRSKFSDKGAFSGQIKELDAEAQRLTRQAKTKVSGPMLGML